MTLKSFLLAGAASLILFGCGDNSSKSVGSSESSVSSSASASRVSQAAASATSPFGAKYTLKNASAFDLDGFIESFGYDGEKPYGSVQFDESLGATIVSNIKFDSGDGGIITIAKAELFGVDEKAIDLVKNGTAAFDASFETIFQKVRLYDINVAQSEASVEGDEYENFTIGGVEFDKLKLRQGGIDNTKGDATLPAQFFNMFDLGGVFFKDMNLDIKNKEFGELKMNAPDMRLVGIGGGKLNSIIAKNLDYSFVQSREALSEALQGIPPQLEGLIDGPLGAALGLSGQQVKVASMEWNGIDASGLLEYGLKGEIPPTSARNLISLGRGDYKDMESYIGGKLLSTTKSTTFSMDQFTWLVPNVIKTNSKDTVMDFTAYIPDGEEFDQFRSVLTKNGLNSVKGDSNMVWDWDDEKGSADVSFAFNTDNFADLSFDMNMGNLKFNEIATMVEEENQAGLIGVGNFQNFSLKIKDKSLLDAVFDIAAIQMGAGTGADLRGSAPAMVRLGGSQITAINPLFSDYVDAVASFLGEGGTIEISAKPDEAVSFFELGGVAQATPQTLPNLLNMKVTHSK